MKNSSKTSPTRNSLQAEAQLASLKQDYERYVMETDEKMQNLTAAVDKLTQEKSSLKNALDEEKR